MSVDPQEAIEKLAKYRQESKKPDFKSKESAEEQKENAVRQFFLSYYWVNATIALTLFFAMVIGGWNVLGPVWVILIAFVSAILGRQTFRTIDRLSRTDGRHTTLDDMFVILLLMGGFFMYRFFDLVSNTVFMWIHITMSVIWVVQIIFVNYLKPELGASKRFGIEEEQHVHGTLQRIKKYMTRDRSVAIAISLVLGVIISVLSYLG